MRSAGRRLRPFAGPVGIFAFIVLGSVPLSAQPAPIGGPQRATREALKTRLATLEAQGGGRGSTGRQQELSAIRARLEQGDFKPGDRFVFSLRQDDVRSDTLVVRDSLQVAVLNLPEFSVKGVLRAELEDRLNAHVSRFLRNAVVRTTLLTRVSVTGAVGRPGFYYAVPDRPINDLLTSAGGPSAEADLNKLTVSRVGRSFVRGKAAKQAVQDGSTLEALDVQSGDTVHIPVKRRLNLQLIVQLMFTVLSLSFAALQFVQWYYGRDI
jgi:hypothetical protein